MNSLTNDIPFMQQCRNPDFLHVLHDVDSISQSIRGSRTRPLRRRKQHGVVCFRFRLPLHAKPSGQFFNALHSTFPPSEELSSSPANRYDKLSFLACQPFPLKG